MEIRFQRRKNMRNLILFIFMSDNFIIYYIKSVNTIICKNKNKKINFKIYFKEQQTE